MSRPVFTPPRAPRRAASLARCAGFTLIELLGVIAIIRPPRDHSHSDDLLGAHRSQQGSHAHAVFAVGRRVRGLSPGIPAPYPQLYPQGTQHLVNQNATTTATAEHLFYDTLTGHRRDPTGSWTAVTTTRNPPFPQQQNARRIQFVAFTDSDLVTAADVTNGYNTNAELNSIRDAFRSTSIAVITDSNLDGVINGRGHHQRLSVRHGFGGNSQNRPADGRPADRDDRRHSSRGDFLQRAAQRLDRLRSHHELEMKGVRPAVSPPQPKS